MIQSMTGFASKTLTIIRDKDHKANISIHLKTLNARYFELNSKLPHPFSHLETDLLKLLKKSLDMAFSDQMRAQDRFKAISFIWANPVGRDLAWEYVQSNWESITKTFAGGHLYPRFIQSAAYFTDNKKADEIEKFFKKNPSVGLERTIAQVTEQIRANDLWLKRDKSKLSNFLRMVK